MLRCRDHRDCRKLAEESRKKDHSGPRLRLRSPIEKSQPQPGHARMGLSIKASQDHLILSRRLRDNTVVSRSASHTMRGGAGAVASPISDH